MTTPTQQLDPLGLHESQHAEPNGYAEEFHAQVGREIPEYAGIPAVEDEDAGHRHGRHDGDLIRDDGLRPG